MHSAVFAILFVSIESVAKATFFYAIDALFMFGDSSLSPDEAKLDCISDLCGNMMSVCDMSFSCNKLSPA